MVLDKEELSLAVSAVTSTFEVREPLDESEVQQLADGLNRFYKELTKERILEALDETEEVMRKCSCGEEFTFDGWNVNEKVTFGNNYHFTGDEDYKMKYAWCDKCGKKVTLSKEKYLK